MNHCSCSKLTRPPFSAATSRGTAADRPQRPELGQLGSLLLIPLLPVRGPTP
jgi:hypothetical protein